MLVAEEERLCSVIRRARFCDFVHTMSMGATAADEDDAINVLLEGFLEARGEALRADAWRIAGKLKLVHYMHSQELCPAVSEHLYDLRVSVDPHRRRGALMALLHGIDDWGAFFHMSTKAERIPQGDLAVSLRQLQPV